jgi:hypothetical protein
MKSLTYRLKPNGWLSIDYVYTHDRGAGILSASDSITPKLMSKACGSLAKGPPPSIRIVSPAALSTCGTGPTTTLWSGIRTTSNPESTSNYPPFKGFYSGVRWLQLNTSEGPITAMVDQRSDSPIYVQVFTPKTPPADIVGQTGVPFPNAGVSFLHAIPAIGSKFVGPRSSGPMGQPAVAKGEYQGHISLYFGKLLTQ